MRGRWHKGAVVTIAAALLVGIPSAANAAPIPDDPTDGWVKGVGVDYLRSSEKISDYIGWLNEHPNLMADGYVAPVADVENKTVTLLWKGQAASSQAQAVDEGQRRNLTVSIVSYQFSRSEIDAAQQNLWASKEKLQALGLQIADIVGIKGVDDRGLEVEGIVKPGSDLALLTTTASVIAEIPVSITTGVSAAPTATRGTDPSPFFAGGYMISTSSTSSGDHVCSVGFGVTYKSVNRSTTARHCLTTYHSRETTANYYGSNIIYSGDGAARVMQGYGDGKMYYGAFNSSSYYSVDGLADVGLNSYVCTSGGNSGSHCNIKVTAMSVSFNDGTGNPAVSSIQAEQQSSGGIASIQGDSGGPVYAPHSGGKVGAVGMIQGLKNGRTTNCGSVRDAGDNLCSPTLLFTSMRTITRSLGASLIID